MNSRDGAFSDFDIYYMRLLTLPRRCRRGPCGARMAVESSCTTTQTTDDICRRAKGVGSQAPMIRATRGLPHKEGLARSRSLDPGGWPEEGCLGRVIYGGRAEVALSIIGRLRGPCGSHVIYGAVRKPRYLQHMLCIGAGGRRPEWPQSTLAI